VAVSNLLLDRVSESVRAGDFPLFMAVEWDHGAAEAWRTHSNARAMVRVLAYVDRMLAVRAACACARRSLVHVPADEHRSIRAIEAAEAWCLGESTKDDCLSAATEAHHAASVVYVTPAAYAVLAAGYAADATWSADCAVSAVAYAFYAADAAALGAASVVDLMRMLADAVRSVVPVPPTSMEIAAACAAWRAA